MSKNNTIRKSDKKFIRREKARIRRDFLDFKKQEEMINELYKRFDRNINNDKVSDVSQKIETPLNSKSKTLNLFEPEPQSRRPKQIQNSKSKTEKKPKKVKAK